ncbi:MAG TPA: hypothetical protein DCP37_11970, partial [Dehalococcoidia bacterium]|nr:hypothetical protein [Dehalococcoidia bacterium]
FVIILAALTMTLGNLVALTQRNIKRLLAYSSIGHVGYLLVGVAALTAVNPNGVFQLQLSHMATNGLMLHLVAYGVTNMAAFGAVAIVYNATGKDDIDDLAGLAQRSPFVAMVLTAALFSLAGLPIFAGFVSKFYLFNAAATQGLLWLAGLAIFTSLISLYYYLNVIRFIYILEPADSSRIRVPRLAVGVLGVLFLAMIFIGVYPAPILDAVQQATDAVLSSDGILRLAGALN